MEEKIEKTEIGEIVNLEQAKEGQEDNHEIEVLEESKEQNKEDLLKKIYNNENKVGAKIEGNEIKNIAEEQKINSFVKEFHAFGSKVINKARKVLGAYGLDELHDKIVDENKNSNKK